MAISKQTPIPTSIESILDDIDDFVELNDPMPEATSDLTANVEAGNMNTNETKPTATKAAGRKYAGNNSEPADDFSAEFEKCLQEFKDRTSSRESARVSIDYNIAETLRLIKGYELKAVVNASLKAMLLHHKDELKKYLSPKPKYIV